MRTEAVRSARYGSGFLVRVAEEAGIDRARVVTGAKEAALAIEASRRRLGPAPLVVLDAALEALGAEGFWVTGRRVRHGLALRLLEQPGGVW